MFRNMYLSLCWPEHSIVVVEPPVGYVGVVTVRKKLNMVHRYITYNDMHDLILSIAMEDSLVGSKGVREVVVGGVLVDPSKGTQNQ